MTSQDPAHNMLRWLMQTERRSSTSEVMRTKPLVSMIAGSSRSKETNGAELKATKMLMVTKNQLLEPHHPEPMLDKLSITIRSSSTEAMEVWVTLEHPSKTSGTSTSTHANGNSMSQSSRLNHLLKAVVATVSS